MANATLRAMARLRKKAQPPLGLRYAVRPSHTDSHGYCPPPTRKQDKVYEVVSTLVDQFKRKAS